MNNLVPVCQGYPLAILQCADRGQPNRQSLLVLSGSAESGQAQRQRASGSQIGGVGVSQFKQGQETLAILKAFSSDAPLLLLRELLL
jgi:hypothetical protein